MSIDISNLRAVSMAKRKDYKTGTRYYKLDILVAKTCSKCFDILHVDKFNRDSSTIDGLVPACRKCNKPTKDKYYKTYKPKTKKINPPRSKEQNRKYREAQNKRLLSRTDEQILEDRKRLRPNGAKTCGACKTEYSLDNFHSNRYQADGLFRYCKQCHHRKNLERIHKKNIRYWKRKNIPIECYVCGGAYEEAEHIIPLTLNGPDDLSNMLPSCMPCNRGEGGKHFRPLREWLYSKYPEYIADGIIAKVISYGINPGT